MINNNFHYQNNSTNNSLASGEIDTERYIGILNRSVSRIDEITRGSENDFLKIGNQLSNYLHGSRELSETSVKAAESISKHILQDGIGPLSALMKEFSGYLSDSSNEIGKDLSSLKDIADNIEKILMEQAGFTKIVKTLKMLGISTKIESVRLGSDEQGFYVLAENVDKLSTLISDKSKLITDKSNQLLKTISGAIENLKVLTEKQVKQSESIISHIDYSISDLESKYTHCSGKVTQITELSRTVSLNIQEMVTSIQFHDITRQQMEHVKEVIVEQVGNIEQAANENDPDQKLNLIDTVACACDLQTAQLKSSSERFYSAVSGMASGLMNIGDNVNKMLSESCLLLEQRDKSEQNPLKVIQAKLDIVSDNLKQNMEIGNSLSASVLEVISIIDELSKYIADIQSIGDEIEIIALNSRVKAARAGINGSALGVLSESIQHLSIDAKNQSIVTTGILANIGDFSARLRESIESISGAERKNKMVEIDKSISTLINSTIVIEGETQNLIEKLRQMVSKMKNQIDDTLAGLNIHEFVKSSVQSITDELEIITTLHPSHTISHSAREEKTQKFLSLYTMHSERDIHNSFASNSKAGEAAASAADDFDSNIELF